MTPTKETEAPAASPASAAEAAPKKAKKRNQEPVRLPFLMELAFQFSGPFLLLISLAIAVVSFLSGAEFLQIFLRTVITIVAVGLLLLWLSTAVSRGMFEAALQEAREQQETLSAPGGMESGAGRQDLKV